MEKSAWKPLYEKLIDELLSGKKEEDEDYKS